MSILSNLRAAFTADAVRRVGRCCLLPALGFYVVAVGVMSVGGFSLVEILRDPAQQTQTSSFLGFVSSIGTWLWLSAAVFLLFPGGHLARCTTSGTQDLDETRRRVFVVSGCG